MALTTKTLAELARLSSGINPTFSAQSSPAPNDAGDSPVATIDFGVLAATDYVDGDGVDVSDATHCVVRVKPIGGDCVFDIVSRSTNISGEFETLNNLEGVTALGGKEWKELIFCGPEDEVIVIIQSGTATSVAISIGPCLG
jgi:hypothetical protein